MFAGPITKILVNAQEGETTVSDPARMRAAFGQFGRDSILTVLVVYTTGTKGLHLLLDQIKGSLEVTPWEGQPAIVHERFKRNVFTRFASGEFSQVRFTVYADRLYFMQLSQDREGKLSIAELSGVL